MNILILNCIITTPVHGVIPEMKSNHDSMIHIMARGFVENGHQVTLVASEEYRPTAPEENIPFKIIYMPSRWKKIFKPSLLPWPATLKGFLKKHAAEYDLIVSSEVFSIPSLIAARYCPDKLVIWQELNVLQRAFRKVPAKVWHNIVVKLWMKDIPVIPRSDSARKFISRYCCNVSNENVDHGANSEVFFPSMESVPEKSFIIIAKLVPRKQIDKMMESFAEFLKLKQEYSEYILRIVGDGPEEENLKKKASALGITDKVVWHGRMTHREFSPLERRSVAFLVNTYNDLNMVSIPEAIVNGTPVLTNLLPSTSSYIKAEKLGIAKDGWGGEDLAAMVENYPRYHANCIEKGKELTNLHCAEKIIRLSKEMMQR